MAVALETVVKQLEDSGIVAPGKLENFVPPKAHPNSVEELIAELVKNNHLTKFQATQVAAGRAKSLILGESLMAKLVAHRESPIPELRKACKEVTDDLEAVFKKMVAKKIEDRYQTMSEVIADLERCSGGSQTSLGTPQSVSTNLENSALTFLKDMPVLTTHKTKATKKVAAAKTDVGKSPPWKNTKVMIGAAFVGVLVLAGIIVSLQTKDGTLIVEVDQPDAMVQVLDSEGKVEVSQKGDVGKVTISVDSGKHRLRVEKDGFVVFGQEFEMESGGMTAITAKLLPVKPVASQPNKPWNTPAFQQWMKSVAAMPAEQQIEAVSKKLMELNPGFDGKVRGVNGQPTPIIEKGVVTHYGFVSDNVPDISPVRALAGLKYLSCMGIRQASASFAFQRIEF